MSVSQVPEVSPATVTVLNSQVSAALIVKLNGKDRFFALLRSEPE